MDLDVVFLGTAGSVPTAWRAPTSLLVRRGGERLLFDCGEGTQRQLLSSAIGLVELEEIFLTHYHADHYLGLPGLLKTFALRGREQPLVLWGPRGLADLLETLRRIFGKLTYRLDVRELSPGETLGRDGYRLATIKVDHRVTALGYVLAELPRPGRFDVDAARSLRVPEGPLWGTLQRGESVTLDDGTVVTPDQVLGSPRPGRRLVISGDTKPCRGILEAALEADLLIHEATFTDEEKERADETGHTTAHDAAELARIAGVKMLALTHLSNRYRGHEVVREARAVFPRTVVPRDFDIIELPFPERGDPRLVKGGALANRDEVQAMASAEGDG